MSNPTPKTQWLWFALCVLSALSAHAQESEDAELAALLAILETETEIATRNKMNADWVPGMVTVLHADELKQYGASTVAQALSRVAGFHVTIDNSGDTRVIVRGVGATLNAGNLKLLLDGVPLNRGADGSADWLLRLPITQVDRVEVIRGPGSSIHGEYAFSGVVNVISRQTNAVGGSLGSHNQAQFDAHLNRKVSQNLNIQFNAALWNQDRSGQKTAQDNFAGQALGNSPAPIYDQEEGQTLQAALDYQGYRLQLQYAALERGPAYGEIAAMANESDPRREVVHNVMLTKSWQVADPLSVDLTLSSQQTQLDRASFVALPAGVTPPVGGAPATDDLYVQNTNQDQTDRANISVHWSYFDDHKVFADIGFAHYEITSASVAEYAFGTAKQYGNATETTVQDGANRELYSLTLQDQWQVSEQVELTLGGRYDRYSDWGSHHSPRVATVWRINDHHIVKAQYAEAFRPPTLSEAYPGTNSKAASPFGSDLSEEVLSSSEVSYIFREADTVGRATVFHTHIEDLIEFFIQPGQPPVWRNLGDIDAYGIELEWQQTFRRNWEWQANLAYVDAQDHLDDDDRLLGAVDWLGNLSMIWHQSHTHYHAMHWHYVSEQEGWEISTRLAQTDRFGAYNTVDYTFGINSFASLPALSLSTGIKNLADKRYNSVPSPAQYPDGLPQGERTIWLALEYRL